MQADIDDSNQPLAYQKIKDNSHARCIKAMKNENKHEFIIEGINVPSKNVNGVYVSGASNASGNNQEELGSRGFTFSGANTFKNGVRFNGSLIPETSSLESIEILKGSSALLYGNVAPGGILNLIRGIHVLVPRNMTKAAGFYNTLLESDEPALVVECLNGYRLKEKMPTNIGELSQSFGRDRCRACASSIRKQSAKRNHRDA